MGGPARSNPSSGQRANGSKVTAAVVNAHLKVVERDSDCVVIVVRREERGRRVAAVESVTEIEN